eukprot:3479078-Pyramimonas_sp.AAC.1
MVVGVVSVAAQGLVRRHLIVLVVVIFRQHPLSILLTIPFVKIMLFPIVYCVGRLARSAPDALAKVQVGCIEAVHVCMLAFPPAATVEYGQLRSLFKIVAPTR